MGTEENNVRSVIPPILGQGKRIDHSLMPTDDTVVGLKLRKTVASVHNYSASKISRKDDFTELDIVLPYIMLRTLGYSILTLYTRVHPIPSVFAVINGNYDAVSFENLHLYDIFKL